MTSEKFADLLYTQWCDQYNMEIIDLAITLPCGDTVQLYKDGKRVYDPSKGHVWQNYHRESAGK